MKEVWQSQQVWPHSPHQEEAMRRSGSESGRLCPCQKLLLVASRSVRVCDGLSRICLERWQWSMGEYVICFRLLLKCWPFLSLILKRWAEFNPILWDIITTKSYLFIFCEILKLHHQFIHNNTLLAVLTEDSDLFAYGSLNHRSVFLA